MPDLQSTSSNRTFWRRKNEQISPLPHTPVICLVAIAIHKRVFQAMRTFLILLFAAAASMCFAADDTGNSTPSPEEDRPIIESKDKIKALNKEESDILQRHNPFYFAYGHELSKLQA